MTSSSSALLNVRRAALVVAHPGHELRVHGWLESVRPAVFVLTDGSGSRGCSRLQSTIQVLERANARPGAIFGPVSDRDFYRAVLSGDPSWVTALAASLLRALLDEGVELVAGDALEGFNPAHDVCRHIIDAVVLRLHSIGREVASYAFALDAPPGEPVEGAASERVIHQLSDDALARKLKAAESYVGLEDEVRKALSSHGPAAFRHEVFWPAGNGAALRDDPPAYERYGEQRRLSGVYDRVIRRTEHIEPLVEALRRFAEASAV